MYGESRDSVLHSLHFMPQSEILTHEFFQLFFLGEAERPDYCSVHSCRKYKQEQKKK